MKAAVAPSQSTWNSRSSGSSSSERNRFSPGRSRGESATAKGFEASTSKARPSTNAGRSTVASRSYIRGGTRSTRRRGRAGREGVARSSRYCCSTSSRLQDARDGRQHLHRRVLVPAALQSQVVVGADAGQHRYLLAAKPADPAVAAAGDTCLLGGDESSPGAQVVAEPVGVLVAAHEPTLARRPRTRGVLRLPGSAGTSRHPVCRASLGADDLDEGAQVQINDRTVFIAGGTTGIGRGLAQRLADAGSTVIVGGRNPQQEQELPTVRIDVTDADSVLRARD